MVIYRHKDKYVISEMYRFLNVSRSGYYGYVSHIGTPAKDLPLAEKIQKCGKTYGYRRVHMWLERNGIHHNPKTILRVMQRYNLLSMQEERSIGSMVHQLHKYPNLLNRVFYTDKSNTK